MVDRIGELSAEVRQVPPGNDPDGRPCPKEITPFSLMKIWLYEVPAIVMLKPMAIGGGGLIAVEHHGDRTLKHWPDPVLGGPADRRSVARGIDKRVAGVRQWAPPPEGRAIAKPAPRILRGEENALELSPFFLFRDYTPRKTPYAKLGAQCLRCQMPGRRSRCATRRSSPTATAISDAAQWLHRATGDRTGPLAGWCPEGVAPAASSPIFLDRAELPVPRISRPAFVKP